MKQLVAIVFSLLLIVTRTFAVVVPVSSGVTEAQPGCCCDECKCCVSESGAPATPPVESTAPVTAQNQFALPPAAVALFALAAPTDDFSPASALAEFRAAVLPIFQRNCALLI
jgi:hypothetical protein